MSPETGIQLLRVVAMWVLSFRLFQADFTASLNDITFGDLQALVLLAAVIAGYK